jgi:hypothetical protein
MFVLSYSAYLKVAKTQHTRGSKKVGNDNDDLSRAAMVRKHLAHLSPEIAARLFNSRSQVHNPSSQKFPRIAYTWATGN